MTHITINNLTTINDNIPGLSSISFNYIGEKIYSATKIDKITGVFISDPITTIDTFLRWDSITWTGTSTDMNIALYARNAASESSLLSSTWIGPYYNKDIDISTLTGTYIQFIIVLVAFSTVNPIVNSLNLKFISSQNSVKFYSKLFYLGFSPKDIMLTYNANETTDSIIRFAVSVEDTINEDKYQFIDPNTFQTLVNLSPTADSIKLMIEMTGNSGIPITINEVSMAIGGNGAERVNN